MADGTAPHHRFGSLFEGTPAYDAVVRRKAFAFGFLDRVCEIIGPTESQQTRAKTSYEAVAAWLAADPRLRDALIYAQGSSALGTMTRPISRNEFDVDLICRILGYDRQYPPQLLKALVGDRLKAHGLYSKMLVEKLRCWRLEYAGEFHLDITPAILNPACVQGGELVPDRRLRAYKPTNPIGYRKLFERRALLTPQRELAKALDRSVTAEVQPYPTPARRKGVLRRTVQLLKVHRDYMFVAEPDVAPLSVILTTLAMRAYELCVGQFPYDNEIDLLCDTIRLMPVFIERPVQAGAGLFFIENETTDGENFAEKWNADPRLPEAFYRWQARALADFEAFGRAEGQDQLQKLLGAAIGMEPVRKAAEAEVAVMGTARRDGRLGVAPGAGLVIGSAASTPVRANTFFGRP